MPTQPKGEELRQAIKWIDAERQDNPKKSLPKLVEEAGLKFNLSPKDAEFLMRFLREGGKAES
jgi:hypothetical protein